MSLERRIEALERSNRRLRIAIAAIGLAAIAGIGLGAAQDGIVPAVLRARSVEIVGPGGESALTLQASGTGSGEVLLRNSKGVVALNLSTDATGAGQVAINSRTGQPVIRLSPNEFGGTINTFAEGGKPLAKVGANGLGQGTFSLFSARSVAPNVTIAGEENGDGAMGTYNAQGQRLIQLTTTSSGVGKILTFNGVGKTRVELGATSTSGFVGTFSDRNDPIVIMSSTVKGDGILRTYSAQGTPLCGFEVDANGMPRFTVYGADGAIAKVMP